MACSKEVTPNKNYNYDNFDHFTEKKALPGEEIVISGIAGMFPNSRNMYDFRDNLYGNVDMVSSDNRRWEPADPNIPTRVGKLFDIEKFDAGFFGIHHRQAESMDPMGRLFLEKVVEAIFDAGLHPSELEATKTGVFIGVGFLENAKAWLYDSLKADYFTMIGNIRSMTADRVAYYLKLTGPTSIIECACSSSLCALEHAFKAIKSGLCDTAIVGGSNLCLDPNTSLQFTRLGVLCKDGICKTFDEKADGYARSEAIVVTILQKAKYARRTYCEIIHGKSNCDGFKAEGIYYPLSMSQKQLLQELYQECNVKPCNLSYLEAHGTGTVIGDTEELLAVRDIFCKERDSPLLIGSVKSNMGHSEQASGLCSIAKIIITMENGLIPANLHFKKMNRNFENENLQVVVENTQFQDDRILIGVSSFGFGGTNTHILLRCHGKAKINNGLPTDVLPRLVCVSGRLEDGVVSILEDLKSRHLDAEYVRLYHQIFSKDIIGHYYRGYSIISKSGELKRSISSFNGYKTKFSILFTNFGESWSSIANEFIIIPSFANSIQRIHDILESKKINIKGIILKREISAQTTIFDNIIGSASVQIALVDILKTLGFNCDFSFGIGFGEIISAYWKEFLTLEETVLSVYSLTFLYQEAYKHSSWDILYNIFGYSKASSFISQLSFSKYFFDNRAFNNFPTSLEMDEKIKDRFILQIGNGNILTKSKLIAFPQKKTIILDFLEILGNLYEIGYNFDLHHLYPNVEYPVSRATPMISPLIRWNHNRNWFVMSYEEQDTLIMSQKSISLSRNENDWKFITDHVIDKYNLFPAAGYLFLVWKTLAQAVAKMVDDVHVVFENCKFLKATHIPKEAKVEFKVTIQKGSGNFEVAKKETIVALGKIKLFRKGIDEQIILPKSTEINSNKNISLSTNDFYKELQLRGYNYKGGFRGIQKCNVSGTQALIRWNSNWISFITNLLQIMIIQKDTRNLYELTKIKRLTIDTKQHFTFGQNNVATSVLPVYVNKESNIIQCGGIEIRGVDITPISRQKPQNKPLLEKYEFVPNVSDLSISESVRVIMQIICENCSEHKIKTVELIDNSTKENSEPISPLIHQVLSNIPLMQPNITLLSKYKINIPNIRIEDRKLVTETDCTLLIGSNLLQRKKVLNQAFAAIKEDGFILSRETLDFNLVFYNTVKNIEILIEHTTSDEKLYLIRKSTELEISTIVDISDNENKLIWLSTLQEVLKKNSNVIIIAQNDRTNGIMGLINCLRRQTDNASIKCVFILDEAPPFDLNLPFYSQQLKKNLAINIYKNSNWGTYRYLLMEENLEVNTEYCFCQCKVPGDFSSLNWFEGPLTTETILSSGQELVYVYYCALNFRDVMVASGKLDVDFICQNRYQQDHVLGCEFAGKTKSGKKIMGFGNGGSLASLILANDSLIWYVPDSWSLEEAATVPVAYATILYAFFIECTIRKEQSILIYDGASYIGQAALNIALHYGLIVFTTIDSKDKREFIKDQFPQLRDYHIFDSRDKNFEQMIHPNKNGSGVDFILNSLEENKLLASVRCLAYGGHLIQIGKFDLTNDNQLYLKLSEKDISIHSVILDNIFVKETEVKLMLRKLMTQNLSNGAIKPLKRTIFKMGEIQESFKYMTSEKYIGKILIQIREEEIGINFQQFQKLYKAVPRFSCSSDCVHIIIGGLGGIGLELVDWLVLRGARKIVLVSRKGVTTGYQTYRIKCWSSYGTDVHISTTDITTIEGCYQLFNEVSKIGIVESIFNLAAVLRDAIFENQTLETFTECLKPKAAVTLYLDQVTRKLCPNLRHFVVFSSMSCGRGNAGQSNYGMANSIIERICEKRREDGFNAIAIQWGTIADVGIVAEKQNKNIKVEMGGTVPQTIESCLETLDILLAQNSTIVSSLIVAEKPKMAVGSSDLVDAVITILGLKDLNTISRHATLAELGMDSITIVELRQHLRSKYQLFLTLTELRSMTFAKLIKIQEEKPLERSSGKKYNTVIKGFEMLITVINEENDSKLPLHQMKSKIGEDVEYPNIIFFPGFDSAIKRLEPLAAALAGHVYCINYSHKTQIDSISEIVQIFLPKMASLISKNRPFNIVAYSYGAIIALEIVSKLEDKGYNGRVFIIDGAPAMLMKLLKNNLQVESEAILETEFLIQVLSLCIPLKTVFRHRDKLLMCKNFEDRLNMLRDIMPEDVPHSIEYLKLFITALYKRLKALTHYEITYPRIKSQVKLFKAQNSSMSDLSKDYELSKICQEPVEVKLFKENHVTILENIEIAENINKTINN